MKPDYEKNTRWLNENGDLFLSALGEEARQLAKRHGPVPSSARWYVYQALVFEACRQAVIKTHKHVKSSEGGAEAAKGRKTAADSEWRTDARKVAQAYVDEAAKAGRKPPTRADVIREIRRRCKATALPRTDRAIGNLIDDMRREGKIKLEQ